MLSLAVDARDSITMAITYPKGQTQQRDPTAEHELKIQPIVQNKLIYPVSYSRQVSFMPERLSCFNKIKKVARKIS